MFGVKNQILVGFVVHLMPVKKCVTLLTVLAQVKFQRVSLIVSRAFASVFGALHTLVVEVDCPLLVFFLFDTLVVH